MQAQTKAAVFLMACVAILSTIILASFFQAVGEQDGMSDNGCPKDVKMCPDGSNVSRVFPDCDFADCS